MNGVVGFCVFWKKIKCFLVDNKSMKQMWKSMGWWEGPVRLLETSRKGIQGQT